MAKLATKIIGKPLVAADTGKKLGTIGDVILDDDGLKVVGLLIRRGAFRGADVLVSSSIRSLGGDAVLSQSEQLVSAKEWRAREAGGPGHADDLNDAAIEGDEPSPRS